MITTVRIFILLSFLFSSFILKAQTDTMKCHVHFDGKVFDGENRQPLISAVVILKEVNRVSTTNEKGEFNFKDLCPGTYTIECNNTGYKNISTRVSLQKHTHRSFILHTDTCQMESVLVTGKRKPPAPIQTVIALEGKELDRTRGLSLGESLKNIPGVNTIQTGPTIFKPVIQGLYGNRVLILNNGVRQEGQQWGSEHAPEIDPFIASSITVIKGASSVRYGSDAIGGVILIEPKELRKEPGLGGEINVVGFSNNRQGVASGILDYNVKQIKGLSTRLQGTLKQAGNSKTPGYYLKNTGFKERNYSWAAAYNREKFGTELFFSQFNTTLGIFSASHIGNRSDLERAIGSITPLETSGFSYVIQRPYQQVSHDLFKSKTHYLLKHLGKIELTLARQFNYRSEYDKHTSKEDSASPQVEFKITTHTGTLSLEHKVWKQISGIIGTSFIRQVNTTNGSVSSFIPNFRSYAGGIFLIERKKITNWEFETGFRYDYKWLQVFKYDDNDVLISPTFNFSNFSGTFGGIRTIQSHWKIRANLGTSFRPPAVNELYSNGLHHGSAGIEIGNSSFKPEYSYNFNTSFNYQYKKVFGEISFYNNYIDNYIYLAPSFIYDTVKGTIIPEYKHTIRGTFPVFRYKQIEANYTGIDLEFNDSISRKFIFSSRVSLLRAYNTTNHRYLILTPPATFNTGIRYSFSAGNEIQDTYIKLSNLTVARKSKVPENEDFKVPPQAYTLWSLETGFTIFAGKQALDFTFSVTNIFNTRYRDYLDRFRYFNDAVGRNFVFRFKTPLNFN